MFILLRPSPCKGPEGCGAISVLTPQDGREVGAHRVSRVWAFPGRRQALPSRPYFLVFHRDH